MRNLFWIQLFTYVIKDIKRKPMYLQHKQCKSQSYYQIRFIYSQKQSFKS